MSPHERAPASSNRSEGTGYRRLAYLRPWNYDAA
jgi:hypothetical protein